MCMSRRSENGQLVYFPVSSLKFMSVLSRGNEDYDKRTIELGPTRLDNISEVE